MVPIILMTEAVVAQQLPEMITWGAHAERLGIIGILVVLFILYVTAIHREWLVPGKMYRLQREETIMWRTAYMELRGTTRDVAAVARIATEKAAQP